MNFLKFLVYYAGLQKRFTEQSEEDKKNPSGSETPVGVIVIVICDL
jgi:hypothetical protein